MTNVRPPIAERRPVAVTRHGEILTDDYAWLRDREDPATIAYLEAENAWAEAQLAATKPLQERLYQEMLGRIKETDLSVPYRRGDWWYYSRTEEGKQYPIHCRRRGAMETGAEEVLLDLNVLAEGKSFMALGDFAVSDDGTLLAYSLDETGFRQYRMAVKHLGTGADLGVVRERVTSIAWGADGQTIHYGIEDEDTKRSFQVWRLSLQGGDDVLEFEEADEAFNVGVYRTRSRAWLVIHASSHTTSECLVRSATAGDPWRVVLPRVPEREYDLEHHGAHFYVRINDTGRNFRLVRIPTAGGTLEAAEEILAHRADVMLEGHETFARHLIVHEREDGIPHIAVHRLADGAMHRISFPEPAYECGGHANPEFETVRYRLSYQSLVTPSSVYEYDLESRERTLLKQQEIVGGYDASRFVSRRLHAVAADGTRVPISLVRRADVPEDGSAPVLIHGYGSYGYPYPVTFSSARLSLLERGMVVAIAHIRGGGELGTPWHDAGKMGQKMNSFTDFIACADELVAQRIVDADKIAIEGGSAGGLLMGAVTNLARDKWAAVVSQVPFVDVLNTMSDPTLPLTVGEYEEWGNPGIAEQYGWMRAYCPYTNLTPGAYPPMLVRTSLNDSQVMYWEPAKYVAKLRTLATTPAPLYLVTNMGAGHGGASGRYDRLREIALDWAFVLVTLGREG
ncbi:MAG TPA: S9 family peptidase [Gemmatimonadales bacterium]|nr:S9 family peptidase [Gemmatimonadales bacterium]